MLDSVGRLSAAKQRSALALHGLLSKSREQVQENAQYVLRPRFLAKRFPEATRVGQWLSLFLMPAVVVVSLALITVINNLMAQVMVGAWDATDSLTSVFAWIVEAITLCVALLFVWGWFQFVRTAGFGLLTWED